MNGKKKVLFVASVAGHIEAFHLPYLQWFKEQGWETHVAARAERKFESEWVDEFHDVPFNRSPYTLRNIKAYRALKKVIGDNSFDVIHCHTPTASALTRMAARKARKEGAKVIYTAHGFHFFRGAPPVGWLLYYPVELLLSRLTDAMVAINTEDYATLRKRGFKAAQKFAVPGIGVDTSRFAPAVPDEKSRLRAECGYAPEAFILFYAAEFIRRKKHRLIIEAAPELKRRVKNLKIIFAGHGPLLEESKRLAVRLGVSDVIDFLGYRSDVPRLVALSDVGVSSSRQEGLAINVVEDLSSGLPVVASDDRGHRDTVIDGVNGYLFRKGSKEDFVAKVMRLYASPSLREEMGKKARESMRKFSIENALKEHIKIYNAVLRMAPNEGEVNNLIVN